MAHPYLRKRRNPDKYNFFKRLSVSWNQFGALDGYTNGPATGYMNADGYGPDIVIPFVSQSLLLITEGAGTSNVVEYSFDGVTVHGDLTPTKKTEMLLFDNRQINFIWFRIKSGSTGPVDIRIEAWSIP